MDFEERYNIVKKDENDEEAARRNLSNKKMIDRFNEFFDDYHLNDHK